MAQSTLEVILQMRSNAKAVLDADAAAIKGLTDAATTAEGPLAGVETQLVSTGRAAGTSGVSLQELVASYKATGTALPEVVRQLVLQEDALLKAKDATTQTADATEGASQKTKEAATAQDALTSALKQYLTTGAILGAIKSSGDYADSLQNMSLQTGIGIESLQRLDYAAKQNGDNLTDLTRVIGVMSDKLGSGDASAIGALKTLGLSFDAIRAMAPDEAFLTISAAVAKIADPMQQAALKTDLFGRSALQIPTIASDMRALGDEAERTGQVIDASAVAAAARFDQTLDNLTHSLKVGITEGLQPFFSVVASGADIIDALTFSTTKSSDALADAMVNSNTYVQAINDLNTALSYTAVIIEDVTGKIRDQPAALGPATKAAEAYWKALRGDIAGGAISSPQYIQKDINDIEMALAKEYEALGRTTPALRTHAAALQTVHTAILPLIKATQSYVGYIDALGATLDSTPLNIAVDTGEWDASMRRITVDLAARNGEVIGLGATTTQTMGTIATAVSGTLGTLGTAVSGAFAQMMLRATGFKDGFINIWKSIQGAITNILSQILSDFANRFIKGLLAAITGAQGGFAGAFANLFSGATGGGGGGTGGLARTALGSLFGAGGVGVGTSIGAGVGAGAGAAGLGVSAGPVGIGAGIGGGGFMAGAGGAALGAGAIGGAGLGLGLLGTKLFGGSGWGASGFGAASGAGTGALIGTMVFPGIGTALGAAIGGLAGAIGGWIGKSQGEKVNDARDEFFATVGANLGATASGTGTGSAFGTVAAKLTAAGEGPGGGQAFQNLITAKDQKSLAAAAQVVLDILVKQQDAENAIAAAAAKAGEEATLAGQAAEAAAAKEAVAVAAAKAEWEAKAAVIQTSIAELATQQQQLADSIKGEAAESVMGVVESRTRAEIDALAAKSAQLEKDLAAGAAAAATAMDTTIEATTAGMIVAGDTIGTAVIPKLEDMINRGINPAKDALGGVFDLFGLASQAAIDFGNTVVAAADEATAALERTGAAATAAAEGKSPGGFKGMRDRAREADDAITTMAARATRGLDGVYSKTTGDFDRPREDRDSGGGRASISINVTVGADTAGGSKSTLAANLREAFQNLVRSIERNDGGLRTQLQRALRMPA